jgi:hypothetical protein
MDEEGKRIEFVVNMHWLDADASLSIHHLPRSVMIKGRNSEGNR